jgi:hypothetical protein
MKQLVQCLQFPRQAPLAAWFSKVCLQLSPETYSCPYTGPGIAPGRPVRSNRGIGGQRDQLEKASAIVGQGLLNKVTGQKRDRNDLIAAIPENLPENDLAPPIPTKRARITSKAVIIIHLSSFCLQNEYLTRFLSRNLEFLTEKNDLSKLHPSLL